MVRVWSQLEGWYSSNRGASVPEKTGSEKKIALGSGADSSCWHFSIPAKLF